MGEAGATGKSLSRRVSIRESKAVRLEDQSGTPGACTGASVQGKPGGAPPAWLRGIEPRRPPTRWISPFTLAGSPHLTEPTYEVL
jgi:hypothetical protein